MFKTSILFTILQRLHLIALQKTANAKLIKKNYKSIRFSKGPWLLCFEKLFEYRSRRIFLRFFFDHYIFPKLRQFPRYDIECMAGVTDRQRMLTPPLHLILPLFFLRGPCSPHQHMSFQTNVVLNLHCIQCSYRRQRAAWH